MIRADALARIREEVETVNVKLAKITRVHKELQETRARLVNELQQKRAKCFIVGKAMAPDVKKIFDHERDKEKR